MRLYVEPNWIKPKYYDDRVKARATWEEQNHGAIPTTNNKLFTSGENTYLWTEEGVFDIHTGKRVDVNCNKCYHPIEILEDNQKVYETHRDETWENHPSYGMIGINHVSGGNGTLFGSSIYHNHYVELTIQRGSFRRGTFDEEYFGDHHPIIKINMTSEQLANLFFATNRGDGVPCTIAYNEMDGYIPAPPYKNSLSLIDRAFEDKLRKETGRLDQYIEELKKSIAEKKTIPKSFVNDMVKELEAISRGTNNLSSYMTDYKEQTEKIKTTMFAEVQNRADAILNKTVSKVISSPEGKKMLLEELKKTNNNNN